MIYKNTSSRLVRLCVKSSQPSSFERDLLETFLEAKKQPALLKKIFEEEVIHHGRTRLDLGVLLLGDMALKQNGRPISRFLALFSAP